MSNLTEITKSVQDTRWPDSPLVLFLHDMQQHALESSANLKAICQAYSQIVKKIEKDGKATILKIIHHHNPQHPQQVKTEVVFE